MNCLPVDDSREISSLIFSENERRYHKKNVVSARTLA